ncbi:MAG TPA: GNAT family N-acetyltransferase [Rhodothermales bacterium]|nr:GNAT family N-acetyltransferase [Rhodothermales bacterium]
MTMAASHSPWTVRPLNDSERQGALAFLDREHELNIYLAARISELGLTQAAPAIVVSHGQTTVAVASASPNLAVAVDPDLRLADLQVVSSLIAGEVLARSTYLRAIISPALVVESLWNVLKEHYDPPTVVRLSQPVYLLDRFDSAAGLREVRHSRTDHLDLLVPACAAMHREEIGIDPMERDAFGYRQRVRDLVEQKRSFVMLEKGEIAFKCEISAETSRAVQLMGVWTAPPLRGRGYARRGLTEVCSHIIRGGRTVTLFVNDFNQPARLLYENLGFRQIGENRALIW